MKSGNKLLDLDTQKGLNLSKSKTRYYILTF